MRTLKLLSTFFLIFASANVLAQSGSSGSSSGGSYSFIKRAEVREQKRWTLEDWLQQRDRGRLMDLWLSLHSPSPYELMLGGAYESYQSEIDNPSSKKSYNAVSGEFSAYAQIFGLTAEYENNTAEKFNDLSGLFNLRVFGQSIQSSSITLSYGLRTRTYGPGGDMNANANTVHVGQQFGQAALQLYFRKSFGIDGQYRYYIPVSDSTLGDIKSDEWEGGVFIDFKALRIYGRYFDEKNNITAPSATSAVKTNRSGIKSGIKIFF